MLLSMNNLSCAVIKRLSLKLLWEMNWFSGSVEELSQCQNITCNNHTNFNCFQECTFITLCAVYCTFIHLLLLHWNKKDIYTLLEIINTPVGQPTKVKPYLVEAASKLERGLGRFAGDSNIRIFLICLKLKS